MAQIDNAKYGALLAIVVFILVSMLSMTKAKSATASEPFESRIWDVDLKGKPSDPHGLKTPRGEATVKAAVFNPQSIAPPSEAPVHWQRREAVDMKKCKLNRNGNGGIFHVQCINEDTLQPSALCQDMAFDPRTMSEPPLRGPGGDDTKMEVYYKKGACDGRWDIRNVIDKGCLPGKIGRQVEIQCRLPTADDSKIGQGVHGCPNMKRQSINGMKMISNPKQGVNRDSAWTSANIDDPACRPFWNVAMAQDKGCRAQKPGKTLHIPCTLADNSLSVGCKDMKRGSIDGKAMLTTPIRNPEGNNAYTAVNISDDGCKIEWDFGGLKNVQCRKDKPGMVANVWCRRPDGSKSLGCPDIPPKQTIGGFKQLTRANRSPDEGALSRVILDTPGCAPRWNWATKEKKDCVPGGYRSWQMKCTNGQGGVSGGCLDEVNKRVLAKRLRKDGLQFVNAKRRDFHNMDVITKDIECEPKWALDEKRKTPGIDCKYGGVPYTVPCRTYRGRFGTDCPDLTAAQVPNAVHKPTRLNPYRSEIYLQSKKCDIPRTRNRY